MTVNNQIVVGTLMNICDDPTRVSVYQEWREGDRIQRTPIIVTGNDLSHMFAPLVRDGRMTKYYWKPDRDDLSSILHQMYKVHLRRVPLRAYWSTTLTLASVLCCVLNTATRRLAAFLYYACLLLYMLILL